MNDIRELPGVRRGMRAGVGIIISTYIGQWGKGGDLDPFFCFFLKKKFENNNNNMYHTLCRH